MLMQIRSSSLHLVTRRNEQGQISPCICVSCWGFSYSHKIGVILLFLLDYMKRLICILSQRNEGTCQEKQFCLVQGRRGPVHDTGTERTLKIKSNAYLQAIQFVELCVSAISRSVPLKRYSHLKHLRHIHRLYLIGMGPPSRFIS